MPGDDGLRGATGWFVRRAGLARCTTIASVAGLALAAILPGHVELAIGGLTLALGGVFAGHVLSRLRPAGNGGLALALLSVVAIGLLGGLLLGSLRVSSLLDGVLASRIGETVQAELVVTGAVRSNSGWQSATAVIRDIKSANAAPSDTAQAGSGPSGHYGVGEKVQLEVAPPSGQAEDRGAGPTLEITQGALLSVKGTLRAPEGPSASGFDQARQLLHQGVQVVLRAQGADDAIFHGQRGGVSGWFDHLRESAKTHLSLGPSDRVNEVLQGVVMGDTAGIDQGWMDAFRRSGTAHMLSVSGLHVASLAAIMIALAGFARLSRRVGYLLAAAAAILMVPFVGSSPPIVRSAAMICVVLAGRWVGRRRDPWQGLAVAAIVVLLLNPFAVFDVGFQLSFSAFAGMLALVKPMERLLRGCPESVRADLAVSLAATLGTAPVSLIVFGRTSLISPVANLLVVPTLGAVTGLGLASVLLGFIWRGFSAALDTLASVPMCWTILVSTVCARAPVLNAADIGRVLLALAAGAAALPAALAMCGRTPDPPFGLPLPLFRRSVAWLLGHRPRGRRRALGVALATVILAFALGGAAYPVAAAGVRSAETLAGARDWPADVEVRMLDVGQGTSVLLRTPQHHAALFDGGPAGCQLASQLRALGVRHLDLVVISHPHADHFAGLLEALDGVEVGTFIDRTEVSGPAGRPASAATAGPVADAASRAPTAGVRSSAGYGEDSDKGEAATYLQLRKRLAAEGCRLVRASMGSSLDFDGLRIGFFAPASPLVLRDDGNPWGEGRDPPSGDELNGGSLVVVLTAGQAGVLLPGDAEADALRSYQLPQVDAIVVGHHGSRGAVSAPLLSALHAGLALISVGEGNTFGHPAPETLSTLLSAGETVVRTDEDGWVSLRLEDAQMTMSTERTPTP